MVPRPRVRVTNVVSHSSSAFSFKLTAHHCSCNTLPNGILVLFFKTILFRPYVFVFLAAFLFAAIQLIGWPTNLAVLAD